MSTRRVNLAETLPGAVPVRPYERAEGEVYCLDHGTVHADTTDPYDYGTPDCRKSEHRTLWWRSKKGDLR